MPSMAIKPRAHDCMDAGGRTTPGAVVENRSLHVVNEESLPHECNECFGHLSTERTPLKHK